MINPFVGAGATRKMVIANLPASAGVKLGGAAPRAVRASSTRPALTECARLPGSVSARRAGRDSSVISQTRRWRGRGRAGVCLWAPLFV